jgi:hypothetical protein
MKRVGSALAALAAATFLSAPVFARTTLANFPGRPQAFQELLAHVHKHKHNKVVVRTPGDDGGGRGGGGSSVDDGSTGTTPSTGGSGSVQPR